MAFFLAIIIALGYSVIIQVSEQNCFWIICYFLLRIRLGLPKDSAESSTKNPPRFSKFRGLWFFRAGSFWVAKKFQKRFHQRSAKIPQKFHQIATKVPAKFCKVRGLSCSLAQVRLQLPKNSAEDSTNVLQVSFFLWLSGPGPSWAVKEFVLGCQKVLWKIPPRFHQGFTRVA